MVKDIFKVIILGDMGVGKTSVLSRFVDKKFSTKYKATIGADLLVKEVTVGGDTVTFQLWDTAGQERFQTIGNAYYRGAEACGLMFDLTSGETFSHLSSWMEEFNLQTQRKDSPFVLIGNKADQTDKRQVTQKTALAWCAKNTNDPEGTPIPYYETSALNDSNIDQVFQDLAETLVKRRPTKDEPHISQEIKLATKKPGRKTCKC